MKKSILAVGFVALLSAGSVSLPAHADELPAATPTDSPAAPTPPATDTPAPLAPTPYKVDFDWHTPANPAGDPYATCDVKFLRTNGSVALAAPYPASITKLSFSFSATEMSGDHPVVPGVDTLSLEYTCSTAAGETSQVYRIDSMVIPDVPPLAPTYVDVNQPTEGELSVDYGGSKTIGAAGLNGYQLDVLKDGLPYSSLSTDDINGGSYTLNTAGSANMMRTASAKRYTAASQQMAKLPAGTYTVQVRGRNAVGLSTALSSKTITVQGAATTAGEPTPHVTPTPASDTKPIAKVSAPGKVRALHASTTPSAAKVTWRAPSSGAVKQYKVAVSTVVNGSVKVVRTFTVSGVKHSVKITGLKAHRTYQLRVTAMAKSNLTSVTAGRFVTKRS